MSRISTLSILLVLAATAGCSSGSNSGADAAADTGVAPNDITVPKDIAPETSPTDVPTADEEALNDSGGTVKKRVYTFKALGGISMGAAGLTFHAHHPQYFDFVAALGGYINFHYLEDYMANMLFAGFCDMETILEHMDELNDPDVPELQCGPVQPRHAWENPNGFNHWHFDDSGANWDRDTYWHTIFEGMMTAFGNQLYYNPEHPFLPPGVPESWAAPGDSSEKCANPIHVGKPWNYNAEYNPEGLYDLITFCDEEEPIPGGEDNPDYWELKGAYDPTYPHNRPAIVALAVDYNGNGKRDYHEPIIVNNKERFQDVGADGCADADEDGAGGCGGGGEGGDPNADNFYLPEQAFGSEGDFRWQEGEPYEDFGLDGVDGTGDYGEGDEKFSRTPGLDGLLQADVLSWIDNAPQEEIDAVDIMLDGGIRDALNALTGMYPLAMHLKAREPNTREYNGYTRFEDSLYPTGEDTLLLFENENIDWSIAGMGKNFIVRYGNVDATEEEIAMGDGKHVGTDTDIFNRGISMPLVPLGRWPGMDTTPCVTGGEMLNGSFYSEALQSRYAYSIALPPCYDEAANKDLTYPSFILLPGHGITSSDIIAVSLATDILMKQGELAKFFLVAVEGQCCRINPATGDRYCVCTKNKPDGTWDCVDPQCKAAHDDCELLKIPSHLLVQECNSGHFFANHVSNVFGDKDAAEYMKYEDMLAEAVEHLDETYRTRPPEEHEVVEP